MIICAMTIEGTVIHKAFDMGGFLYIACHADPTTLRTHQVGGNVVTCKKCLKLVKSVSPNYNFADGIHALKHPFCRKADEYDGFGAGWHDGREGLAPFLTDSVSHEFLRGYREGYKEGQLNYQYQLNRR